MYFVNLAASRDTAFIRQITASTDLSTPLAQALSRRMWTSVALDVDFTMRRLAVRFDGVPVLESALAPEATGGFAQLSVGIRYYANATVEASSAHFDDIVVQLR